jgi:tetratricopeptide (TPR) repeat protein
MKVFCPSHRVSFAVLETSNISCDAGGHALSGNFPFSEVWEYCCDCQSFWPVNSAGDATPRHVCMACENELIRFYLCDNCQVISAESDEATRRKAYRLPAQSAPHPSCPGCLTTTGAVLKTHDCSEFGLSFLTARLICPFCEDDIDDPLTVPLEKSDRSQTKLEEITISAVGKDFHDVGEVREPKNDRESPQAENWNAPIVCPKCATPGKAEQDFCQNCGSRLGIEGQDFHSEEAQRDPRHEEEVATRSASISSRTYLKGGIVVALIVVAVLIVVVAITLFGLNSVERRLDSAIAKGSLLAPPGESAYDLYHQLKRDGASASTLARYDARLLPLLTTHPKQMLSDITDPERNGEPSIIQWDEAAKLLAWANEIRPQDTSLAARAAYCTGRVSYLNKNKDDALRDWKRASDLDRMWALPENHIGLVYNERHEYVAARSFLTEAIRREPQWAVPYNNLGTSFYYEKNYGQAESYYEQARDRAPRWARPHAWLGELATRRGDYSRAIQEFETVLNLATADNSGIKLDEIRNKLEEARQKSSHSVPE